MIIHADAVQAQPWKNGGGRTRELIAGPSSADWQWRLSLADIDTDGPFSAFPGVQRWFAVLEGDGVALRFCDGLRRVLAGDEALCFDGAQAPGCALLGGRTRDLNLMLRAGTRGEMRRARPGEAWTRPWPLRGRFDIAAMTLHWALPQQGPLTCSGPAFWIGIEA